MFDGGLGIPDGYYLGTRVVPVNEWFACVWYDPPYNLELHHLGLDRPLDLLYDSTTPVKALPVPECRCYAGEWPGTLSNELVASQI
ncbi:hypothetical protein NDU88_004253 [Pleurodeles waltl]|uniref:Uncharacterized protein n=1 Tax=Pleurodeles waltl TaxID=8319 RepID=A0AAV7T8L7_PLEWA|nr:hypothetical protein NDU88_004253 [Pleurodeles waltl]